MIITLIDFIKKYQSATKILGLISGVLLLLWSVFLVDHSHAHTWAEKHIPFFWSFFGFTACAVLVLCTRVLGRSGIQTRETYYDE